MKGMIPSALNKCARHSRVSETESSSYKLFDAQIIMPTGMPRLRRSESFVGLHFDMHATQKCNQIGKTLTAEMIRTIIKKVRPDYIQCDCKGTPGIASYPTKIGNAAPGFVCDPLKLWRDVTARHGVALYVHYCGLESHRSTAKHTNWARLDENGLRDAKLNSVFGPYADRELIPQMKELITGYDIDGAWIDADCWITAHDYCEQSLREFQRLTGITKAFRRPGDKYFHKFTEFCREAYRRYLDHYVTAVHRIRPEFQICCNWAYSSFMPEPACIKVDFLSGDYSSLNSINHARFEARCLVHQGKPWDLMAWCFASKPDGSRNTKSVLQLQQEAAITLSLGGGVSFYLHQQKLDASVTMWEIEPVSKVFGFCRQRQPFCHRTTPIGQIALLLSGKSYYQASKRLFCPCDPYVQNGPDVFSSMRGILNCLLESQNVVDITMEHHLTGRMREYPLIIIPEWKHIAGHLRSELMRYVETGGNLLVIGPGAGRTFANELGVKFQGKAQRSPMWLGYDHWCCGVRDAQKVKLLRGTSQFGRLYYRNDSDGLSIPAASIRRYGKGKIAGIYANIGDVYAMSATPTLRSFLSGVVRKLFPTPMVEVKGSQYVDVTLSRLGEQIVINLVNTAGPHDNEKIHVFDEIPSVGPLKVKVRTKTIPRKVMLEPDHIPLSYSFSRGSTEFEIKQLAVHSIIVID